MDIVEFLRSVEWMCHSKTRGLMENNRPHEAADEIERLREALQKIVDPENIRLLPSDENPSPAAHKLIVKYRSIARKALKGKE